MNAYNSKLGYFFLVDISGFMVYLVGVELEHVGDILQELLEYIAEKIRPAKTCGYLWQHQVFQAARFRYFYC